MDLHPSPGSKICRVAALGLLGRSGQDDGKRSSEALQLDCRDSHHIPTVCFNYTAAARDTVELGMDLIRKIIKIWFIKLPKSDHRVIFIKFLISL